MIIPFIIVAAVITADQISKYIIKTNMEVGESFNFIKNILNIHYMENEGASFGILKDHRWVFMIFSSIALVFMCAAIFYLSRKSIRKYNRWLNIALAFMFGGGVGNMIDRAFNESAVRESVKVVVDFLEFDFVNFAIFNLADTFISIGSILFCLCIIFGKYKLSDKEDVEPKETEEYLENSGEDIS